MTNNHKASMAKRQREMEQKDRVKQREARRDERRERAADRAARGEKGAPIGEPLPPISDMPEQVLPPPRERAPLPGPRLYIGNLSYDTTADMLREVFAQHGEVTDAHVMTDRDTGRPRGFGFVTMARGVDAEKLIREVDGTELDGRSLRVSEAEDRNRSGGGGGRRRA